MIRVVIGDSLCLVRNGLRSVVTSSLDMQVIKEVEKSDQLLELVTAIDTDVLITDLMMNQEDCGVHGLELLRRLKLVAKDTFPIIIILAGFEPAYALRLMREGISGCLTLGSSPDDLVEAIRTVHSGERYLSKKLKSTCLMLASGQDSELPHMTLSLREYEVFIRLAKGYSITQIASDLLLSPKTISTYRKRAMEKLSVASNTDLIRYAIRCHLIRN